MLKQYSLQSKYLLQHFLLLENIRFKIFVLSKHSQNLNRNLHSSEYSLANIRIQANVCFEIFAYKQMFASKYLHTSEYLLRIASNYIGKPFHRSLILGLKPVLFASKQRNTVFALYLLIFTSNRIFAVHLYC